MRIKLTKSIPVPAEHGLMTGREFDVVKVIGHEDDPFGWAVKGDLGDEFAVLVDECEVIDED